MLSQVWKITALTFATMLMVSQQSLFAQGVVDDNVERAVLLDLYNATNGSAWQKKWRLTQINSYPNPDSIPVGSVVVVNGDITQLVLDNNLLNGPLPQTLNRLTGLQVLSLRNNNLTGTLPTLDSLTNLITLDISGHDLSGTFPNWIHKLTSLKTLNFRGRAYGSFDLTGPIPASIRMLTQLQNLDLSNNDFSGTGDIPDSLSYLDNLSTLYLEQCKLTPTSVDQGLTGLAGLDYLNLSRNPNFVEADGSFPAVLGNLPQLSQLVVQANGFDSFPPSLSQLPALVYLDMSYTTRYANENILSSTIDVLKTCSIKTLLLQNCQISSLPEDFYALSSVETLWLSLNPLSSEDCSELGYMPKLKILYVYGCSLTSLPTSLSNSTTLQELYAFNNNLQPVPTVVKDIPNLQILDLTNNNLTSLPEWFGLSAMDTLTQLKLRNNQLVTLPENFTKLRNLQQLDISYNQLNGTWPVHFDSLANLRSLNLSNNQIDSLPDLSDWHYLSEIYLQQNLLSGSVPAFLSDNTGIKTALDISFNQYTAIDSACTFSSQGISRTVTVSNNQFTFEDVLAYKPPSGTYSYSPQGPVDTLRTVVSFPGSSFSLTTVVDTLLSSSGKVRYQWYKYGNGGQDSVLSAPSEDNHLLIENTKTSWEGDQYYYTIRHLDAPDLVLKSRLQTLVFSCQALVTRVGFNARRYLCAMSFKPDVAYSRDCSALSFEWNFGDGSSSTERTPWHAYGQDGTFTVSMKVRFDCGPCQSDSTITKQVTFSLPQDMVRDSVVQIDTDVRTGILSVSAATFADAWPLQHGDNGATVTSYLNGTQGVWRNDAAFVFDAPRLKSTKTDIARDGTFTLEHFNWTYAMLEAIPQWTKATAITRYSPYSYELENRDVLDIYSAALYDYGGHLPSANGVNMRNDEMAFTGFEFLNGSETGNLIFGNAPLPEYTVYTVRSATNHIAVVEASIDQLSSVAVADVSARGRLQNSFRATRNANYIQDDPVVCIQQHPTVSSWSMVVLRREPFPGLWSGQLKVRNQLQPAVTATIDSLVAHTGQRSLKITSSTSFEQKLLNLDSGKTYFLNAWVSVNNPQVMTPKLADNLGVEVVIKSESGVPLSAIIMEPVGPVIEGWQQVRGTFTCPRAHAVVTLKFLPGSGGQAWYDDIRIHPEKGNMKSYVYDLRDYRLRAILDEENFATRYYYDDEGNLFLVKKETQRGIKTVSENVSYQIESNTPGN